MLRNNPYQKSRRTTPLVLLAVVQALIGEQPTQAEIDHAWHTVMCEFCAKGVPLENGKHTILGIEIPCDAEPQEV